MHNNTNSGPFGQWAQIYRDIGLQPRPLIGKACKVSSWQKPDDQQEPGTLEQWDKTMAHCNIGLLMGTPLPDGTFLGALDIDHDDYVALGRALLNNPPCGRIGKKGAVFFFRYSHDFNKKKFCVKGEDNKSLGTVAELLTYKQLCVIPPSIHPDTNLPYDWLGTPLHKMDLTQLPFLGE